MVRVFVIGAGLLGNKIVKYLKNNDNYEVFTGDIDASLKPTIECPFKKINITNYDDVSEKIGSINPDLLILTAAMTNVDGCERNPELADKVNVEGPYNVAKVCKKASIKLIHVSTDFVFDGVKGNYKERDIPNPINVYGSTKLRGENKIRDLNFECIITRTSVLYGDYQLRFNFVTWIIDELRKDNKLKIVDDQFASPTLADDLARTLIELYENKQHGLFHVPGSERINRLDFAYKIAEVFGLNKNLIIPIKSKELNQFAKRPKDSSLCVDKINSLLDKKMMDINDSLKFMKKKKSF